jgi:hypothetical protein
MGISDIGGLVTPIRTFLIDGSSGVQLSEPAVEGIVDAIEPLARAIADKACASDNSLDCAESYIKEIGARAFRRPLIEDEVTRYKTYYEERATESSPMRARTLVAQALLVSPHTMFLMGIGQEAGDHVELDAFEKAQALSYFISDGPPDDILWQSAKEGRLDTPSALEAEAARLLSQPETSQGLLRFFDEAYRFSAAVDAARDPDAFDYWTEHTGPALSRQTEQFIKDIVFEEGTLQALLTSEAVYVNKDTAPIYGVDVGSEEDKRFQLEGERFGFLTQGAFLATHAKDIETDPITRGHFVREILLCQAVPPVPDDAINNFPDRPEGSTVREWLEQTHSEGSGCNVCHNVMDPIGFTLEGYDAAGAVRTEDLGRPVKTTGMIAAWETIEEDIPLDGPQDLANALLSLPEFHRCFTETLLGYAERALSNAEGNDATCAINRIRKRMSESDNIAELAAAIVADPVFATRTASK